MRKRQWTRHRPLFASPVPAAIRKKKIRWRVLPVLWAGLKRTCMLLGALVLLSSLVSLWALSRLGEQTAPSLPGEMVLYLTLEDGLSDLPKKVSLAEPFGFGRPTVHQVIAAIDRARDDPRVKGLLARMESGSFSIAHVQELRAAIARFKESGKFTKIYSSSYGDMGGGLGRYYLAAAFDEIWMQPLGTVAITGVNAEMPFAREALDKIGIRPQFLQRKEYKTAYESLTNREISPENREMLQRIVADIRERLSADTTADRGMEPKAFAGLVDTGLFTAEEALESRLIDRVDYGDTLLEEIKAGLTGDPEDENLAFIPVKAYLGATDRERAQKDLLGAHRKPRVALVYAVGTIMPSDASAGTGAPAFIDDGIAAADEIAPAIADAAGDEGIRAIVLRIDSPGGSPIASERILRAIVQAQAKGKKVIVSMGPTAASGGYWIASYADRIFTLPSTLTGSIGVVGGKFVLKDLWAKLGVNWDGVQWGENAELWSPNAPFSEGGEARMAAMLDRVYSAFIARVARGRKMEEDAVEKIARGRVWTGQSAVEIGLADEIGGLDAALDYAARELGKTDRSALNIQVMPAPKTPLEQFIELIEGQVRMGEFLSRQAVVLQWLEPAMHEAEALRHAAPGAVYEPLSLD